MNFFRILLHIIFPEPEENFFSQKKFHDEKIFFDKKISTPQKNFYDENFSHSKISEAQKIFPDEKNSETQKFFHAQKNFSDEYISLFENEPLQKTIGDLKIFSAAIYYSQIRSIIHDFKFNDKKILCEYLGRAMGKFFPPNPEIKYLIPVPLHIDSTRKYNQSYELAKFFGETWNVEVIEAAKWSRIVPRRTKLNAQERRQLSPDDFMIIKDIRGRKAAIIDDICTTGATLENFAKALEETGVWVVCAYTLAMTCE